MSDASNDRVRLKRLKIEGLFGEDAPPIDIEFKLTDRVTVLHGPNGSGKTIILGLIEALRNGRYRELWETPFARLELETNSGALLELFRDPATEVFGNLDVRTEDAAGERFDNLVRVAITSEGSGEITEYLGPRGDAFDDFCSALPPVKLIGINRLLSMRAIDVDPVMIRLMRSLGAATGLEVDDKLYTRKAAVERIGEDIRAEVSHANQAHLQLTAKLDATLAQRLIQPTESADVAELSAQYERVRSQEQRLIELGLLREAPANGISEATISPENAHIFATVLGDRQQRLDVYQELADKAQRIVTSLNGKFQRKSVRIDADTGYHITSASGQAIELAQLSSGEQHELIMMHELLFDIEPGTVLLIDEPELSLHPTWQEKVLPEMLEIARLSKLDVVMATHSPYIANDRTDLMVQIGGRAP